MARKDKQQLFRAYWSVPGFINYTHNVPEIWSLWVMTGRTATKHRIIGISPQNNSPTVQWISEICPPWWILMEACSECGATLYSPVGRFHLNVQERIQNWPKSLLIFCYSQQVWLLHQLLMNYVNIELFMRLHSTILTLGLSKCWNSFLHYYPDDMHVYKYTHVFTHVLRKQIELHFVGLFSTLGCRFGFGSKKQKCDFKCCGASVAVTNILTFLQWNSVQRSKVDAHNNNTGFEGSLKSQILNLAVTPLKLLTSSWQKCSKNINRHKQAILSLTYLKSWPGC